jgi:hypothetical protein
MVVELKEIKAERLHNRQMQRILRNAVRRYGRVLLKDMEQLTSTWDDEPKYVVRTHVSARVPSPSVEVYTTDQRWKWIDKGTRPHPIWAGAFTGRSKARTLAFPSAFAPKSRPNKLRAYPGKRGGPMVYTPYVEHPGIKARNWTRLMEKKHEKRFKRAMEKAMVEAGKASGASLRGGR